MEFFDSQKSIIENLSLASGPIVALLGITAIFQLWLTKRTMTITSQRQAAEFASKQVEIYATIIKNENKLYREEKFARIKFKNLRDFTYSEISKNIDDPDYEKNIKKFLSKSVTLLNEMEAFAIYFVKGVADEEIAYSAVGRAFCSTLEYYAFDICYLRKEDKLSGLNNVVKLYGIWKKRIKLEKANLVKNPFLPVWWN